MSLPESIVTALEVFVVLVIVIFTVAVLVETSRDK